MNTCGKNSSGFTLIEMMITIAIATILVLIAVPNLMTFVNENRITTQTNELITDLSVARGEAVRRGVRVAICIRNADASACDVGGVWATGWIMFTDNDADGAVDTGETILKVHEALPTGMTITGFTAGILTYSPSTTVIAGAAFTLCKSGYFGRVITISATGRPSTAKTSTTCT